MSGNIPKMPAQPSLWRYFARAFVRSHQRRPVSFYLLLALIAISVLGVQLYSIQDNPRELAFFLTLNFIVCFVIVYRAIADAFDILRDHRAAKRELLRETLADKGFSRELGDRVKANLGASDTTLDWPEQS